MENFILETNVNKCWKELKKYGFEENIGQFQEDIRFVSKGRGCTFYLLKDSILIEIIRIFEEKDYHDVIKKNNIPRCEREYIKLKFINSNDEVEITGRKRQPGKVNYINNTLPNGKIDNVNVYTKVWYKNLYHNIDMIFYIHEDKLEYDFIINPGGDIAKIKIASNVKIELDEEKNARLIMEKDSLRITKPIAYEAESGEKNILNSSFILKEKVLSIAVEDYSKDKTIVIDPILLYSTYLGGTYFDEANGIAIDDEGNSYITGYTTTNNFPVTNTIGGIEENNYSTFVTKFNSLGELVYSTIVSGNGQDIAMGIVVDSEHNSYVTGYSSSINFPTTKVIQDSANGLDATILYKLNSRGDGIVYSILLHGNGTEIGYALDIDEDNNAYITGYTTSSNFPTTVTYGVGYNGTPAIFITKFNPLGSDYIYSAYINGDGDAACFDIKVDSEKAAYFCGYTNITDFPFTSTIGESIVGSYTMIVGKLTPTGNEREYITKIGGSENDAANGIAIKSSGNAVVVGNTASRNFPITRTIGVPVNSTSGIIVLELNSTGDELIFSTLINGDSTDFAQAVTIDKEDNMYITGYTYSQNFPYSGIFGIIPNNSIATFIIKLVPDGSKFYYSVYINGANLDIGTDIALYGMNPFITGYTRSSDFPTLNAYQDSFAGVMDTFILGIEDEVTPPTTLVVYKETTPRVAYVNSVLLILIRVVNVSEITAENVRIIDNLSTNYQYISSQISLGRISESNGIVTGSVDSLTGGTEVSVLIWVYPIVQGEITNTATITASNLIIDAQNAAATVTTTVVSVYDLLTNPTYGLEEIKNEVRNIESITQSNDNSISEINRLLTDSTYGLSALSNEINENINETRSVSSNNNALSDELNNIENTLNKTNDLIVEISGEVSNSTYELATIQSQLANIRSLLENIECNCATQGLGELITKLQITINNYYNNITTQNQHLLNVITENFQRLEQRNCYFEEALKVLNEKINYLIRKNI